MICKTKHNSLESEAFNNTMLGRVSVNIKARDIMNFKQNT
jgi:hypothetical protein